MKDAITIIKNNKIKTVIEMKAKIIDFLLVYTSPYVSDNPNDPSAAIILLENDLVTIDLKTEGFPQFQHHHYSMSLGESPITICDYIIDPNWQFYQSLLASREKVLQQKQQQQLQQGNTTNQNSTVQIFSNQPYPISGGIKCSKSNVFPYNELVVTGHEDGSVKIWDASGIGLVLVQKLKTQKLFDKRRNDSLLQNDLEFPFKIIAITLNNYYLAVAAAGGHVTLYKYYSKSSDEELADIPLLEVPINYESLQETKSNDSPNEQASNPSAKKDLKSYLRTKIGFRKQAGYQPELVCLLSFYQRIPVVNTISINPKNTTLMFGTEDGFVCVDFSSRTILYNVQVSDLYSNQEFSHRNTQKSPKKSNNKSNSNPTSDFDELNLTESFNAHHLLSKQFTIEGSFLQQNIRDTISQNSSNSSTEYLVSTEGISYLAVNDNASPNQAIKTNPDIQQYNSQLWLGTNYGTVVVLNSTSFINTNANTVNAESPLANNTNNLRPTSVVPSGHVHTLKGQILNITFLDANGNLYGANGSPTTSSSTTKEKNKLTTNASLAIDFSYIPTAPMSNSIADNFYASTSPGSSSNNNNPSTPNANINSDASPSPTTSGPNNYVNPFPNIQPVSESKFEELKAHQLPLSHKIKKPLSMSRSSKTDMNALDQPDKNQYAVLCSESEIKLIALPTQTCLYKYQITDGNLAKANVTCVNSLAYLTCYHTNGSFLVFNLINLKPNLNASLVQTANIKDKDIYDRINKTFMIGNKGHSYFMCSPSEIQKCFLSTNNGFSNLAEMFPELFDPKIATPPAPKPNIFKTIFSSTPVDREELFGENSGKPSTSIIKSLDSDVSKTAKGISELKDKVIERGEKLSALQLKTEEMTNAARAYASTAHELANKYKKQNKWL